jgi:hypothetical protein
MPKSISWSEAVIRVGRQKYGSDWIGSLTEREQYLVEQYCEVPVPGGPSIPPRVRPLGATLEDEVGRTDDRRRWKVIQDEYANKWLRACGFSYPRVNLSDLNLNLQEDLVNQSSEDDIFGSWSEDDSVSGVDSSRLRPNPTHLDGASTISRATAPAPALGMDQCEAKANGSAESLDCAVVEPCGAVREPHRPYKLPNKRPKRELSGRVWDYFKELDRKGQLQSMKQYKLHQLIKGRFQSSGEEVICLRTMRRILGLNADS